MTRPAHSDRPVHRRVIVPWHDSESICLVLVLFLVAVFWFGCIGILEARSNPASRQHLWVPLTLVALSAGVIVSITIRLVRRFFHR